MKRLVQAMRERDIFGHSISLNFDKKGDSHRTVIGGFFSILIKVFLIVYIIYKGKVLIYGENDTNVSLIKVEDLK